MEFRHVFALVSLSVHFFETSIIEWSTTLVQTFYVGGLIHATDQSEMW